MISEETPWAEKYREYLWLIGTSQLSPACLGKLDFSGVIQVTMLESHQTGSAELSTEADRQNWLRRIFVNTLLDELRRLRTYKRDVRRERSLDTCIDESVWRLKQQLQSDASSPSVEASRAEQAKLLIHAIAALPPMQRQAIE